MKLRSTLIAFIALLPFVSKAQSSLTIFSEDGYKFYLLLNGQKQNPTAQANVRIDGLSQPYYSARILFDDPMKGEISKNIPVQDAATNAFADVVYKIKTGKDGQQKMRYFSATPVAPNYVAPPDVYVMHFGQPAPAPMGNTVTQQTTITTTAATPPPAGASLNVNAGGVNMSINVNDPMLNGTGGTVTQTTTTTTTSYSDGGYSNNNNYDTPPPPAQAGCRYPMDGGSFSSAKQTIGKASFEDTKLSTAKTILTSNCVSTDQVIQLCKLFSFEASKLDLAKFAYSRTTDPGNYFKVGSIFTFDGSKNELNDFISGH